MKFSCYGDQSCLSVAVDCATVSTDGSGFYDACSLSKAVVFRTLLSKGWRWRHLDAFHAVIHFIITKNVL